MSTKAGFKSRITAKGLKYANDVALEHLCREVLECSIPDQEGRSGDVKYEINRLNVTEFVKPDSSIKLEPSTGLVWRASGTNISGHGKWHYKLRHRWLKVSDSGKFDIRIRNLSFSIKIDLGNDESGRPSIKSRDCTCHIDDVDVKFHGGAAKIYNLFKGQIGHKLKHVFMEKICNVIKNLIDKDAAKSLAELPVMVELGNALLLDYRLVSPPVFTAGYVETNHKGEVFWKTDRNGSPMEPQTLPILEEEQKMFYLCFSSHLFNTLLYQTHINGLLKYVIKSTTLPEKCKDTLKTTSTEGLCIGMFIPQLAMMYPDSHLQLHVTSKDAPSFSIHAGYVEMICNCDVEMHVENLNKATQYLFALDATLKVSANFAVQEQKLVAKIGDIKIKTSVTDSNIGCINEQALQFLVDCALKIYAEPMLNEIGEKGFPLPVSKTINFENLQVLMVEGALVVATDVRYRDS